MQSKLAQIIAKENIRINELMSKHTSFKIGGTADILVTPGNIDELQQTLKFCNQERIPFFIFGMGSNILVTDNGFRGVAIKLGKNFKDMTLNENQIEAKAGIRLSELARRAAQNSLSGLEFAEGIPGSLGGAIVMNAGAYGGEIKDVVKKVSVMNYQGEIKELNNTELDFGYRTSILQKSDYIVIGALLELSHDNREDILERMQNYARRRREKQPLDLPSAGSTFKRPPGFYVGTIIEEMGLKGYKIGGAQISDKHAGFIVNTGNATAKDVLNLIAFIQENAKKVYNIDLEPEIKIIGENN